MAAGRAGGEAGGVDGGEPRFPQGTRRRDAGRPNRRRGAPRPPPGLPAYRTKSSAAKATAPCTTTVSTPWPVSASTTVLSVPGKVLTVPGW